MTLGIRRFALVGGVVALVFGCGDSDSGTDASSDALVLDVGPVSDGARDSAIPSQCDLDAVPTPWPTWVPPWPGSGRNASGRMEYRFLADGPEIQGLRVENVGAMGAVVVWSTPGEADSAVGWGTAPDGSCTVGYRRTGGRLEHRMALGPLQPGTEYHVTVRSRDDTSQDVDFITFTTAAQSGATELTGCTSITAPGSYRLAADVTGGCSCIVIDADDVELDLGWHTVTYADSTTGEQCHGIEVLGSNARVSRGTVVQGTAGGDLYSHAVTVRGADHVVIDHLWLYVHTSDAFGLRSMWSDDVAVRNTLLVSEVRDVTDRHYPGNRGIALDLPAEGAGEVVDCILFGVPHWGIMLTGGDRLETSPTTGQTRHITNNHVFADMHATNGYGLGVHANFVEVDHNEIRPLHNGRALHYTRSGGLIHHNIIEAVELIAGDPTDGYAYYSDLADSASPHDIGVCSWVVAHGIRVEGGNFGEIHRNEVYTYSLLDVSFGATSLNISTSTGAQGGIVVHHNQFVAHQDDGSISCSGGLPMVAGWVRGEPPVIPADLHDNRFVSNGETLVIEAPTLATSTDDELVPQ
jgi:hypothetical protein